MQNNIQTEREIGLVTFAFNTSTYFQYNGKVYKRLHGTALASQVSVGIIVAGSRNSDTKHQETRYYFPVSTRHSAAWNKDSYYVFALMFSRSSSSTENRRGPTGFYTNHPHAQFCQTSPGTQNHHYMR